MPRKKDYNTSVFRIDAREVLLKKISSCSLAERGFFYTLQAHLFLNGGYMRYSAQDLSGVVRSSPEEAMEIVGALIDMGIVKVRKSKSKGKEGEIYVKYIVDEVCYARRIFSSRSRAGSCKKKEKK